MPYRIQVGGVPVECDSIEEAVALAQAAGVAIEPGQVPSNRAAVSLLGGSRWTEARMRDFFGHLKGNLRKLVDELLDHSEGRTDAQLVSALDLKDGRKLAGVFTGLYKNAKKVGADPNDVYKKQAVTIADRRVSEYTLTESFRRVAIQVRPTAKK